MKKPSSTTSTSKKIDTNLETPRTKSRFGCMSTVFRRILRRNTLPTHPADHDKNTESCMSEKGKCSLDEGVQIEAPGTPNLVAKLMGLDSIPVGNLRNDLSSVARSRSMNSAEAWREFDAMQGRPRRTKSFREIPSFLELEDENFYIFSFENGYKNRKLASKGKKSEKGFAETEKLIERGGKEVKQRNESRGKSRRESVHENSKENLSVAKNCSKKGGSDSETILKDKINVQDQKGKIDSGKHFVVKLQEPLSKKKDFVGGKTRIKKRMDDCLAIKTNETESNSQNSNPDLVLDDVQLPVNGNANNTEVTSRLTSSKSRRTLWEELENLRKLNNSGKGETSIRNDQEVKESKENGDGSSKIIDFESKIHAKILKESCKLAEEEMLKSTWKLKEAWKLEDYEKIGENLEAGILEQMIHEEIDQLTFF
ncbi:hypothetical protein Leryth_000347 [Lithospermum erythrorhizon]|nr:hypothetical protein Leryth_000347 [Lithospermum erythrorhizon]